MSPKSKLRNLSVTAAALTGMMVLIGACSQPEQRAVPDHMLAYYKQQAWEDGCAARYGAPNRGRRAFAYNSILAGTWDQAYELCPSSPQTRVAAPSLPGQEPTATPRVGAPGDPPVGLETTGTVTE